MAGDDRCEPGAARLRCCVPYCRRSASRDKFPNVDEIICGKHWRLAPKAWRVRKRKIERYYRRHFGDQGYWNFPPGSARRLKAVQAHRLDNLMWDRIKRHAIEVALGIS
jgi:hypothetical protein